MGCKTSTGDGSRPSYANLEYFDLNKGVVLGGEQAAALFEPCSRSAPQKIDEAWNPSADRIERLEAFIPDFLFEKQTAGRAPTEEYFRQYAGFIRGGHYYIYANFFTIPADSPAMGTWRTEAVNVCDGGEEFFGIVFDVVNERFSDYRVNSGPSRRALETSDAVLETGPVLEEITVAEKTIVASKFESPKAPQESDSQESKGPSAGSDLIWPSDAPQALPSMMVPLGSESDTVENVLPLNQPEITRDLDELSAAPDKRKSAAGGFQNDLKPWPARKF